MRKFLIRWWLTKDWQERVYAGMPDSFFLRCTEEERADYNAMAQAYELAWGVRK